MKCLIAGLLASVAAIAGGCNHLAYVHSAVVGVDVTVAPDSGTTRLSIGYDRETFAIVPRYTPQDENGNSLPAQAEAMSLVSVSNVDALGIQELIFNHVVVTGAAAKNIAKDPQGLKMMREAVFGPAAR